LLEVGLEAQILHKGKVRPGYTWRMHELRKYLLREDWQARIVRGISASLITFGLVRFAVWLRIHNLDDWKISSPEVAFYWHLFTATLIGGNVGALSSRNISQVRHTFTYGCVSLALFVFPPIFLLPRGPYSEPSPAPLLSCSLWLAMIPGLVIRSQQGRRDFGLLIAVTIAVVVPMLTPGFASQLGRLGWSLFRVIFSIQFLYLPAVAIFLAILAHKPNTQTIRSSTRNVAKHGTP